MNKFFFVTQVFYPDETATASVFTDLTVKLAEYNDITVEVWCAQPSYLTTVRQARHTEYKDVKIKNLPGTNFQKENLAGRLLNYFTFTISLFFSLVFSKDKSPIFTVTNPPFLGAIVLIISKLKSRKYIYIIHDIYPDGIIKINKLSEKSFIAKIWSRLNKIILRNAEKVVVLGRDMADVIKQIEPASKIEYIPNGNNEELILPINFETNPFVIANKLTDKFVVQYSGNMGIWHDIYPIGSVAKKLEKENIHFLFIGAGIRKKELYEAWENKVPDNTIVLPYQPKAEIGQTLTACHVAIITLREGLQGMAVPSKLYGILAAGVPIIGMVPENSEIALVIREENCGYVINPRDEDMMIRAILDLRDNPEKQKLFGQNSRKAFEKKYTTKIVSQKYYQLISKIYS